MAGLKVVRNSLTFFWGSFIFGQVSTLHCSPLARPLAKSLSLELRLRRAVEAKSNWLKGAVSKIWISVWWPTHAPMRLPTCRPWLAVWLMLSIKDGLPMQLLFHGRVWMPWMQQWWHTTTSVLYGSKWNLLGGCMVSLRRVEWSPILFLRGPNYITYWEQGRSRNWIFSKPKWKIALRALHLQQVHVHWSTLCEIIWPVVAWKHCIGLLYIQVGQLKNRTIIFKLWDISCK